MASIIKEFIISTERFREMTGDKKLYIIRVKGACDVYIINQENEFYSNQDECDNFIAKFGSCKITRMIINNGEIVLWIED